MTDDVFLITGASRGIGAAAARMAAQAGYRLVLTGRDTAALDAVVAGLGSTARVMTATCDVTDWAQVRALTERVTETYGRIDAVFANAGMSVNTSFLGNGGDAPETWGDMVLTNVCGPALTARATLPALVETRGHLVLTGSVAGRHTRSGNLYAATKWAVTGLAAAIRSELVGTGVRTTVVQPGLVDTAMVGDRQAEPKLTADDVARAVMYAVEQPASVNVNEIVVRPTGQRH